MRRSVSCALAALVLTAVAAGLAPAAHAQTADGETPANEGVCDVLLEATAGLYGVCVAFCEAQDCDFEGAVSGQCEPPDPRLLDVYESLRGPNDPDMPCLRTPCPCYTESEIQEVDAPFDVCRIDEPAGLSLVTAIRNAADPGEFAVVRDNMISADTCEIRFRSGADTISRVFLLAGEELAICRTIVVDWIDFNGGCPAP